VQIRVLDTFNEHQTDTWYAALHAGASAGRIAPPVVPKSSLLSLLQAPTGNVDRHAAGVWDGDVCLGTVLVELPLRNDTHVAEVDVNVRSEHRRCGIGSALLDHAIGQVRAAGRRTLTDELNVTEDGAGAAFARARGFEIRHTERRLMLDVPMPEEQLAALERHADPAYRAVTWAGPAGEEWLDSFARMRTLMEHDVPIGERDHEPRTIDADWLRTSQASLVRRGYGIVTAMVVDADGAPVAYTQMFVTVDRAQVLQDDTFVLRAHRGHGLGTLAKVANLRQLAALHPEARHVQTWTAEVNDAMRKINERFGFREVETMHVIELPL
jgi:GNAT superfamily N-acetyltransferase